MQDNRQLYILGAGGLFAILCLLPSWDFLVKIIISTLILAAAMALAFIRCGQDRIALEEYLWRQIRYRFGTWRYSYRGSGETYKVPTAVVKSRLAPTSVLPVTVDWDGANIYFLLTVWLAVVGAYFTFWLYLGGSTELAGWLTGKN
jgi:hypothetical protein